MLNRKELQIRESLRKVNLQQMLDGSMWLSEKPLVGIMADSGHQTVLGKPAIQIAQPNSHQNHIMEK